MKTSKRFLVVIFIFSLSGLSNLDAQLGPLRQRAAFFGRQLMRKVYQVGGKPAVQKLWQSPQWQRLHKFLKSRGTQVIRPHRMQKQSRAFRRLEPVIPKRDFVTGSKLTSQAGVSGGVKPVIGSKTPNWKMIGAIGGAAAIAGYEYSKEKEGLSATEEYLKIVGRDKIEERLETSSEATTDLIEMGEKKLIPREKEHSKDYICLYHGQDQVFLVSQDFQKMIFERLNKTKVKHYEFFRSLQDLYKDADVKNFLEQNLEIRDVERALKKILLSTNTSFPGNLNPGSSTFSYYSRSKSMHNPDFEYFYFKIIQDYFPGIDKEKALGFVERLKSLQHDLYNQKFKYGLLQQIFIPKKDVAKYVYLSESLGVPIDASYKKDNLVNRFRRWFKERLLSGNRKTLSFLNEVKTNPKEIENLTDIQTRILLDANLFGNPNSGIKIYRYHHIPDSYIEEYEKKLTKIVDDVVSYKEEDRGGGRYIMSFLEIFKKHPAKVNLKSKLKEFEKDKMIDDMEAVLRKKVLTEEDIEIAIKIAQELIKGEDFKARQEGYDFLLKLVEREEDIEIVIKIVQELIKGEDFKARQEGYDFLLKLVEREEDIEIVIKMAQELIKDENWVVSEEALTLFEKLVERGEAIAEAFKAAQEAVKDGDSNIRGKGLVLFKELAKRGEAIPEAFKAAQEAMGNRNLNIRSRGMDIFEELAKRGKAIPEVIKAAQELMKNENPYIRGKGLDLFIELVKKGKAISEAIEVAQEAMENWDLNIRSRGMDIFEELAKRGEAIPEVIKVVQELMKKENPYIRGKGLVFFKELAKRGEAIPKVIKAAQEAMKDEDSWVRREAVELLEFAKQRERELLPVEVD